MTTTDDLSWSPADVEDEPATGTQPDPAEDDAPDDTQDDRPASVGEVQRIRARARDAEAERDTLRTRVERMQLREVETIAGQHLAEARDLLLIGNVTMAELVGEDGEVDTAAVTRACAALVQARGERFARRRTSSSSADGGVRGDSIGRAPTTLSEALAASWQQERQR